METVRSGVPDLSISGQRLLEKLGFEQVRVFSRMRRPADGLPSGIGESRDVELRELEKTAADAELLTRLANDAFSEHFGHRDGHTEDEQFWMEHAKDVGYWDRTLIAWRSGEPVGFLVYGYNARENEHLGEKRGWLFSVGVLKRFRNQGFAKALMLAGMNDLRERGMTAFVLGVDDTNATHAFRLYKRLGFEVFRKGLAFRLQLPRPRA